MISKKYVKDLDFNNIVEFYYYVIDSSINGNFRQTKKFINKMSVQQFKDFLRFQEDPEYLYFIEMREVV